MSHWKSFGLALLAAAGLLGGTADSACAQTYATEWTGGNIINLGLGVANGINDSGEVAGTSGLGATIWSQGQVIGLGPQVAYAINNAGGVVGVGISGAVTE
jgi:hypothetical protein